MHEILVYMYVCIQSYGHLTPSGRVHGEVLGTGTVWVRHGTKDYRLSNHPHPTILGAGGSPVVDVSIF